MFANGNVILGSSSGTTALLAANAVSGTVSLISGSAGDYLLSSGSGRTPYWATPYASNESNIAVQAIPSTADTVINLGTLTGLPAGITYSNGLFTNNSGRTRLFTFFGKIQMQTTSALSAAEVDFYCIVSPNHRPFEISIPNLTIASGVAVGPAGAVATGSINPWWNFNVIVGVPNGQTIAMYAYCSATGLSVGGVPAGGFGSTSSIFVSILP